MKKRWEIFFANIMRPFYKEGPELFKSPPAISGESIKEREKLIKERKT